MGWFIAATAFGPVSATKKVPIHLLFSGSFQAGPTDMALKNQALTVQYIAWNTSTNAGQTGDAANHTLRGVGDGTEYTPAASPAQVDAVNLPGVYKVALAAGEVNYNCITLGGISSTANVVIIPITITTERGVLPTVAPNAANGFITNGTGAGQLNVTGGNVTLSPGDSPVFNSGTAQAGGATTITLAAGASATDSLYIGDRVKITSGTGAGQSRAITGYVGATKVATVDRAWTTNPDVTSVYAVVEGDAAALNATLQVTAASLSGVTFPPNFNLFSIDASGRIDMGKILGTASAGVAGYVGIDWSHVNAPTTAVNLSGTTISTVSGNVVGTVGSVAGSVGSVTAAVTVGGYAANQDPETLVLNAAASSFNTAGTIGAKINSAASAGDPWATVLPGGYVANTAGNILGNRAGFLLAAAGLDSIFPEAGVNARQALAVIGSAVSGKLDGVGTGTQHTYAMNNPATLRITYSTDTTGRTTVSYNLP